MKGKSNRNSQQPAHGASYVPLAYRMRPTCLAEFVGQHHLLREGAPLWQAIQQQALHSMILWGPPGSGKTTLAQLLAASMHAEIEQLSAVLAGVKEVREIVERAQQRRRGEDGDGGSGTDGQQQLDLNGCPDDFNDLDDAESGIPPQPRGCGGRATVLFVDEIHRFNKAQQDAFLPFVENGTLILIGATTENPSFELNSALLSRARVYRLQALSETELVTILQRAWQQSGLAALEKLAALQTPLLTQIAQMADGDARQALNYLELWSDFAQSCSHPEQLELTKLLGTTVTRRFDKHGEQFYNLISALHKSVRGSDPHAALYWLARMVDGGCDIAYLARRIVRMASEDIGNADPRALSVAVNAAAAFERLGSPEGELALAQAVVYLAVAPKSNAVYLAYKEALQDARQFGSLAVPLSLCNAPTALMKQQGYGQGYRYPHDEPGGFAAGVVYFPEPLQTKARDYYRPTDRGLEARIGQKLARLQQLNEQAK